MKPYESHEIAYRMMKKKGLRAWGDKGSGTTGKSCDPGTVNFLNEVLGQPYAPKGGKAIELGCGTGPLLRRVCKKGFSGLGIDVSKTAIAMAKEQSAGLDIRFRQGDACCPDFKGPGKFDLAIDGLCLHCITDSKDRIAYMDNVFRLLKDGGLFVLLSMCGPMDRKRFLEEFKGQKLIKKVILVPFGDTVKEACLQISGRYYMPSRYIGHWKEILAEVCRAGFELKLIRYKAQNATECTGTLMVGAIKRACGGGSS